MYPASSPHKLRVSSRVEPHPRSCDRNLMPSIIFETTFAASAAPRFFSPPHELPPRQPFLPDTASPAPPLAADKVAAQQIQVPLQTPASELEYSCSRRKPVALRPNNSACRLAHPIARSPEMSVRSSVKHPEHSIGRLQIFVERRRLMLNVSRRQRFS